jgi:solute carrier family 50 protein (sugar transporter)
MDITQMILASNFPGLVLSLWLNMGAAKLQYFELRGEWKDSTEEQMLASESLDDAAQGHYVLEGADAVLTAQKKEYYVLVPQEVVFLRIGTAQTKEDYVLVPLPTLIFFFRIVIAWVLILIWVGWLQPGNEATTIGLIVNVNLIFFYGAPLQTMQTVIKDRASNSIHVPTMMMNWFCTSFWLLYGIAQLDPVIYAPNAIGLLLGITQGILCLMYPRREAPNVDVDMQPLLLGEVDDQEGQAE